MPSVESPRRPFEPLRTEEFEALKRGWAWVLGTTTTPVLIPGEAILAIEAIATAVAAPGRRILNLVSGPYGLQFGRWLEARGAEVVNVRCAFDEVLTVEVVAQEIRIHRPDALAVVQAETATGGTNPTAEILALAKEAGALSIVDAVSAVGAEPVRVDAWGADFVAVGAQKALAGPNGLSAVAVSPRAWDWVTEGSGAYAGSILSLADHRVNQAPGNPVPASLPVLEARDLLAAFRALEAEGLDHGQRRHAQAARAFRRALAPLGLEAWQGPNGRPAPINTTVKVAPNAALLDTPRGLVAPGDGELRGRLWRVNHYGANASLAGIEDAVVTLANLVGRSAHEALAEAQNGWEP